MAIIIFACCISSYLVMVQSRVGVPYWDVFIYLNNALMFAGLGEGYKLYLPPLLSFLTSLVFRAGYIQEGVIFAINGIVFALGILGMYLLLKLRFSLVESFAGALLFASCTIILSWATTGALDVMAVCLTLLTIYTAVYGLRKDERILYLVFPLAALAFLTRYTSGLMVMPLLFLAITELYSRVDWSPSQQNSQIMPLKSLITGIVSAINQDHLKKLLLGALLGILIMLPFFGFFYSELGNPFPFMGQLDVSVTNHASTRDPGYMPDNLYYVKNIPHYISSYPSTGTYEAMLSPHLGTPKVASYLILLVAMLGFMIGGLKILKGLKNSFSYNKNGKNKKLAKIALSLILLLAVIASLFGGNYLITEALFLIFSLSLYMLLKELGLKDSQLDILMLVWLGTYLISHSFLTVKVDRYFITMVPALVYLIMGGVRETGVTIGSLLNKNSSIKKFMANKNSMMNQQDMVNKNDSRNLVAGLLALGLVLFVLSSSLQPYIHHVPQGVYANLDEASIWLQEYDPQYQDKVIYSNHWPSFSWYLKTDVKRGFPSDFKTTEEFSDMLQSHNATYYINTHEGEYFTLTGYHAIYKEGSLVIYEKD